MTSDKLILNKEIGAEAAEDAEDARLCGELPLVEAALDRVRRALATEDDSLLVGLDAVLQIKQLDPLQRNSFKSLFEDVESLAGDFEDDAEAFVNDMRRVLRRWSGEGVFSVRALEQLLNALKTRRVLDGWERAWTEGGYAWELRSTQRSLEIWWDEDDPKEPRWVWVEWRGDTCNERTIASLEVLRQELLAWGDAGSL
jgi:hypothetical protein